MGLYGKVLSFGILFDKIPDLRICVDGVTIAIALTDYAIYLLYGDEGLVDIIIASQKEYPAVTCSHFFDVASPSYAVVKLPSLIYDVTGIFWHYDGVLLVPVLPVATLFLFYAADTSVVLFDLAGAAYQLHDPADFPSATVQSKYSF